MAKKKTPPKAQKPQKKTIAQKTTAWRRFWTPNLLRWLAMIPLAGIWYIFTFLMAGYSFSALVCLCLIGVLLFYNVCNWTKKTFPKIDQGGEERVYDSAVHRIAGGGRHGGADHPRFLRRQG